MKNFLKISEKKTKEFHVLSINKILVLVMMLLPAFTSNNVKAQSDFKVALPPKIFNVTQTTNNTNLPIFTNDGLTYSGYQGEPANFSAQIQYDSNGAILFFIVDNMVYDKIGRPIGSIFAAYYNGDGEPVTGCGEIVVVEIPNRQNAFYIISSRKTSAPISPYSEFMPYYCILDMSMQSLQFPTTVGALGCLLNPLTNQVYNNGAFDFDRVALPLGDFAASINGPKHYFAGIAVAKRQANGNSMVFALGGTLVQAFEVTPTGINPLGTIHINNAFSIRNEMEVYDNGGHYTLAYYSRTDAVNQSIKLAVFDKTFNEFIADQSTRYILLNNSTAINNTIFPKGLEFSPNGYYLYFTNTMSASETNAIKYAKLCVAGDELPSYNITPPSVNQIDYRYSFMEVGKDKKLYIVSSNKMLTINEPDFPLQTTFNQTNFSPSFTHNLTHASLEPPLGGTDYLFGAYILNDQIDGNTTHAAIVQTTEPCASNQQTFSINTSALSGIGASVYNIVWTVDPSHGTITKGQGTNTITVNLDALNNLQLTETTISVTANIPGSSCTISLVIIAKICCGISEGLNVGFSATGNASNPSLVSSWPSTNLSGVVVLDGYIRVDQDLIFDNAQVLLSPNTIIDVVSGITFTIKNNSILKARCNKMWDGIYVNSIYSSGPTTTYTPGILEIYNNCTIQDAKNAVVSSKGGLYKIRDNVTFNKNFKHIVVKDFTNSNRNAVFDGYVRENTLFTCKQTSTTLANDRLMNPYLHQMTAVAIEIKDVDNIKIGDEAFNGKNTFEKTNFGIFSTKSSVVIRNNSFSMATRGFSNYQCPCARRTAICGVGYTEMPTRNQRRIIIGGEGNVNQTNSFENLVTAIDIRSNINVDVIDNSFNTISKRGIKIYDNIWGNHTGHKILGNNMTDVNEIFIELNNNNCPKVIDNNKINYTISSSATTPETYLATGISVSELITDDPENTHQSCQIEQNTIKAVKNGIICNLAMNLSIANMNNIELNTANYNGRSSSDGCGICLNSCINNVVSDNTIVAANQWNWWVNGIWLSDCITNRVTCNAIAHVGFGLRFSGLNYTGSSRDAYTKNQIWNNRMHRNNCGFVLTDGSIGDVKNISSSGNTQGADNFWTGDKYDGNSFFHTYWFSSWPLESVPQQYFADKSRLYMKASSGIYGPDPFFWAGKYSDGSGGYVNNTGDGFNVGVDSRYGFTFGNFNLHSPINYLPTEGTGVAEGQGVNIACHNVNDLSETLDLTLDNLGISAQNLPQNTTYTPQQSAIWWENYNLYLALRNDNTLASTPELISFKEQTDLAAMGKLEDIKLRFLDSLLLDSLGLLETKMLNQTITTNNELEENIKKTNEYFAEILLMQKDSFTISFEPSQLIEMQNMAWLCPAIYGPAIYAIRSMLNSIDSVPISYISSCEMAIDPLSTAGNSQRRGSILAKPRGNEADFDEIEILDSKIKEVSAIKIYPNPANSFLLIESALQEINRFEISDVFGNTVIIGSETNSKQININTSSLASGVYLLKVFQINQATQISKITIIK